MSVKISDIASVKNVRLLHHGPNNFAVLVETQ